MILNTIILGLIFSILGFGIFISFKILNFTDLTAEASFTLGAAISIMLCQYDLAILGIIGSLIGGAFAGFITAILHTKLKIDKVLAGILTLTAFYTINLWVTKLDPNIMLEKSNRTIFFQNNDILSLLVIFLIVVAIIIFLIFFFKTKMIETLNVDIDKLKILGLMLSNMLIALSGAIFAQYQRYYDSSFGVGMMVVGVATIIIGEALIRYRHNLKIMLVAIAIGSIIYRFIYLGVLHIAGEPTAMKLISALAIIACICLSKVKIKRKGGKKVCLK